MTLVKKTISIRRTLLVMIVGFALAVLILSISIFANMIITDTKIQTEQNVKQLANFIASQSASDVKNNRYNTFNQTLSSIEFMENINYVHIYRIVPNSNEVRFFTSYNRRDYPAIPEKQNEINALSVTKFYPTYLEFIIPIKEDGTTHGYVYVQSNLNHLNSLTRNIIITLIFFIVIALISTLIIVAKLQHTITTPIKTLISTIQQVSKVKDYSIRCDFPAYRELYLLSQNINILLDRTEKNFAKKDSAEKNALMLNDDLKDKLSNRTDALKESNQELLSTLEKLHQFQGQLVESEKMASLGDMVAGVAHEVNTPIGLGVTASTLLSDRINEIKVAYDDKSLKSSQLKKFLNEGAENVAIIYRNLKRAADLISSFKKVAVDQSHEESRFFNMTELLNDVLLTLAPQIKNLPFKIELNCPDDLSVTSKPGPIIQILINLILNSIIHGFEGKEQGTIIITVSLINGQLNIMYQDDGLGIEQEMKNKVFEPFTTTKRGSGGSGLGLHLVYNLITQALGGSIKLESEPGKGVHFEINFPVN